MTPVGEPLAAVALAAPVETLAAKLGASFAEYGFAIVADHGIDPRLIARTEAASRAFFALPEAEKRRWQVPGIAGARGYTPFGTEVARGETRHDLKEFWHVGRELPPGDPLAAVMPPNVWPEVADFRAAAEALYAAFERAGAKILAAIALHLGLAADWFDGPVAQGNSVMRLLHYPPVIEAAGALRAAPHADINAITLLLGAEEAGLELQTLQGAWLPVQPPPGAMVVNIGDMLARLTNDRLRSTVHRVRNPEGEAARRARYSLPFFLHFRPDFTIRTLPQCVDAAHPDRYPQPITANAFLDQRLREIGLK